ncbi:ribonuclease R, partial [Aliarcobacter butzleri]
HIELKSNKAINYKDNDVLIIDNKEFEEIKFIGNLDEPKIDEFISLYLNGENYRDEIKIEPEALMNDEKQRVDLTTLP